MGRHRGTPRIWDEVKNTRLCVTLTPAGKKLLLEKAEENNLSLSELIERFARGEIFDSASSEG